MKRFARGSKAPGLILATLILCPLPSWAAGGEGGSQALIWQTISFVLILVFLIQALKKPMRSFLLRRHEAVRGSFEQASQKEEKAEIFFKEWSQKMDILGKEIAELHDRIRQEGQAERDRMISRARQESDRIRRQAQTIAEQEVKKARAALKAEMVDLSVALAEEILKETTRPEDQERLVRDYIGKVRELP